MKCMMRIIEVDKQEREKARSLRICHIDERFPLANFESFSDLICFDLLSIIDAIFLEKQKSLKT